MRPRWSKVLSDLWDNKLRTLLVVLSISVGVFAIGMIAGAYAIIAEDLSVSYALANPANIQFYTSPFDKEIVSAVEKLDGVREAEGRRELSVRIRNSTGIVSQMPNNEWHSIDLLANSDFPNSRINLLKVVSGKQFPGERELVIDKKVVQESDIGVGNVVEIELADGSIKIVPVSGVIQDQSTAAGDFLANPLGFITMDTLSWLRQPEKFNRLYVTVQDNQNSEAYIQEVSNTVSDKLEKGGITVARTRFSKTNEHPMATTVQAILGILGALGILIVFLSSSLIANTLNALLNQHQRFIGVMKLVGARTGQIIGMYLVLILLFSLIALAFAVPLGARAAYALSEFIAEKLNFNLQGNRIIPVAFVIQILVALLVPIFAGLSPVIKGSRVSVQDAINGIETSRVSLNKGWFDRLLEKINFLSRPYLISLRNTFRRKGRLGLTLFTLTMGGAIFIAVFNVQTGLENHIKQIGNYFLADVSLSFDQPYRISEINSVASEVPGVQHVEGWAFASGEALHNDGSVGDNIQLLAPPENSKLVEPILIQGRWLMPGDQKGITISETLLESFPGLRAGDILRLKLNGKEADWTVLGIFKFVGAGGDNNLAYANYEYISELLGLANRAYSYRIDSGCQEDPECQNDMVNKIDQIFRARGYNVSQVEAGISTLETASESLNILVTFLLIMALLTAFVGSIGLTGTMGMNVLERTREIGIMRSIGAGDWQIIKSVIFEGVFIGLISWALAAIVSFPITWGLSMIISLAIFQTPIDLVLNWQGYLIWLGLVLIFAILASILPAWNASRLTIREVLAYE